MSRSLRKLWLLPICLLLALTGCSGSGTVEIVSSETQTQTAQEEAMLTYESFDGGGPEYSVTIDDPTIAAYESSRSYSDPDHEMLDGAGYTVELTFRGLRAGETTVRVSARSPIADNYDEVYALRVDDALGVTLTLLSSTNVGEEPDVVEPTPMLVIRAGGKTFYASPAKTDAAQALAEYLSAEPLRLTMQENGGFEKVGTLPWALPQDDENTEAQPGDVMLYQGDKLCLFYGENTADYTPLAVIGAEDELYEALGAGDADVTFSVEWSE